MSRSDLLRERRSIHLEEIGVGKVSDNPRFGSTDHVVVRDGTVLTVRQNGHEAANLHPITLAGHDLPQDGPRLRALQRDMGDSPALANGDVVSDPSQPNSTARAEQRRPLRPSHRCKLIDGNIAEWIAEPDR